MTDALLRRTIFLLDKPAGYTKGRDAGHVFFTHESTGYPPYELFMDKGVWRDMGEPKTITVSIEPGDKIGNEEAL